MHQFSGPCDVASTSIPAVKCALYSRQYSIGEVDVADEASNWQNNNRPNTVFTLMTTIAWTRRCRTHFRAFTSATELFICNERSRNSALLEPEASGEHRCVWLCLANWTGRKTDWRITHADIGGMLMPFHRLRIDQLPSDSERAFACKHRDFVRFSIWLWH